MNRFARRAAAIAWPAFLTAGVLEIAVFAFVDPATLHTLGGAEIQLSDSAIYSCTFFIFWVAAAGGCLLSLVLERDAREVNAPPMTEV
jgi:hypothetical protein